MDIASACLCGIKCRYNGKAAASAKIIKLFKKGKVIPLCPEQLAGLPTPRPAVEIVKNKILDAKGNDFSKEFIKGAKLALKIALFLGCQKAYLKSKSPSCGAGIIYDGSFQGKLKKGDGIFAKLLKKNKIKVFSIE